MDDKVKKFYTTQLNKAIDKKNELSKEIQALIKSLNNFEKMYKAIDSESKEADGLRNNMLRIEINLESKQNQLKAELDKILYNRGKLGK